jgi:hypothetical protein
MRACQIARHEFRLVVSRDRTAKTPAAVADTSALRSLENHKKNSAPSLVKVAGAELSRKIHGGQNLYQRCGRQGPIDRRNLIAAQLRLLAVRAEQGLPIDRRSLLNLIRACRAFFRG